MPIVTKLRTMVLAAGLVVVSLGAGVSGLPAGAAATSPASVATVLPDPAVIGSAPEQAAGSCWEIKQKRPTAPDGAYWLLTPRMTEPQQFYCDQTTNGGGWVMVGKGRNGWTMDDAGRGSAAALLAPGYAGGVDTHQYSAGLVNALLNGARPIDLPDGIRVRRAMDATGTKWQEVRFALDTRSTGWSWALGARFDVGSWSFTPSSSLSSFPVSGSGGRSDYFGTGSSWARVRTVPAAISGWTNGFAYGDSVTGTSATGSYLWAPTNGGGRGIPVAQVFLRPRVSSDDAQFNRLPDSGTPAMARPALHESNADELPWGVSGLAGATSREGSVEVQDLLQAHGRMYVGGNFRYVQRDAAGTGQVEQPFLAAFDVDSGEWISSFRPSLNEQVRALALSPTGAIIAGGDFTRANGDPATVVVALDPDTGATDTSFRLTVENRVTGGDLRVWALQALGNQLYIGGEFSHLMGGGRASFTYMRNLARVRITDGRTEAGWNPEMSGAVIEIDPSGDGSRMYAAGFFNTSRGVATRKAAAVLTQFVTRPDGTIQHLADPLWAPVWSSTTDYQQAIVDTDTTVWSGGAEHSIFGFNASTFNRVSTTVMHGKGDVQTFSLDGNVLYAGSHSNNQYTYTGATTWSGSGPGGPWTAAHTQHWIGAYDATTGASMGDFTPSIQMRVGAGVWTSTVDSKGRLWIGGDLEAIRTDRAVARFSGGFARFAERDSTAPATPLNFRVVSSTAGAVTLAWDARTDPSGVRYQVLRDDRPIATTNQTRITVPITGATGDHVRFFVRTADGAGNISASTSVLDYVVPANQAPVAAFDGSASELSLSVDASASADSDGTIASYSWDFGDGATGSGKTATHTFGSAGSYPVRLTVTDDQGATSTSVQTFDLDGTVPVNLVARDAAWTWRYLAGAPGAGWNAVGFDDSTWQQGGTAALGWAPSSATQPATNIDTYADDTTRPITAYFRRTFQVADPNALQEIVVRSVADDGAVFYVNGVEVGRQNMPTGAVGATTYASTSRRLSVAESNPVVLQVPAGLLVAGTNVIAAETHVNFRLTADLTFYLSLDARTTSP